MTSYADQPGYRPISEGVERLSKADRVVMHNGLGYDLFAINRFYPGAIRFEQIYDTLIASRLLDPVMPSHSLEAWGEKLGHPKATYSDFSVFNSALVERCEEDVKITVKVYNKVEPRARPFAEAMELEHQVALVIALQEQNGFRLDLKGATELESELRQELVDIERELQKEFPPAWVPKESGKKRVMNPKRDNPKLNYTAGWPFTPVVLAPFNPGSRKQIEARLRRRGWVPAVFTDSGAAKLDETTMRDVVVDFPEAKTLVRYFRVEKQLGQLADGDNGWLKLYREVNGEARVYGRVNTMGAITYRMSHFKPNMAQVDKKDLRMRRVWIPRDGWKLVGIDADGLELRMLGHYLAAWDNGAFMRAVVEGKKEDGTDPHTINQVLVGLYKRDNAKRVIYALIYGAGDPKLGLIIIEDADEAEKPRPGKNRRAIGKKARAALLQGIVGLLSLTDATKKRHKEIGSIKGLDGRRIFTRSGHSALNTLLQGGGAIVMKKALAIFHFDKAVKAGLVSSDFLTTRRFAYCANVHDEAQIEAHPDIAEDIGKLFADCIVEAGKRLNLRCPLAGSYTVGDNWADTH